MNRAARLAKIEATQKLCDWCAFFDRQEKAFGDSLREQGVVLHVAKPSDLKHWRCKTCGARRVHDRTFVSASDRKLHDELSEQQESVMKAGQEKMPPEWWAEWLGLFDRCEAATQKFYGAAYDVAIQKTRIREFREWMAEMAANEQHQETP